MGKKDKNEQIFNQKVILIRLVIIWIIFLVAVVSGLYARIGLLWTAVLVGVFSVAFMALLIPPYSDKS